jgi:hypothetical protein
MDLLTVHSNPLSGFSNTAKGLCLSSSAGFNSSLLHELNFNQLTSIRNTKLKIPITSNSFLIRFFRRTNTTLENILHHFPIHLFVPPSFRGTNTLFLCRKPLIIFSLPL